MVAVPTHRAREGGGKVDSGSAAARTARQRERGGRGAHVGPVQVELRTTQYQKFAAVAAVEHVLHAECAARDRRARVTCSRRWATKAHQFFTYQTHDKPEALGDNHIFLHPCLPSNLLSSAELSSNEV